jgi:cholesterol transport system auxiliary component
MTCTPRSVVLIAFLVVLAGGLAGCLGGHAPAERYLRLTVPAAGDCVGAPAGTSARIIAMRGVTSLPGLERRAVLFMTGGILSASPDLYWEGPPPELVDQYLDLAIGCAGSFRTVRPFLPRGGQDLALDGRLLAFEVHREGAVQFVVSLRLTATDGSGRNLLGTRVFEVRQPVAALDAEHIAAAGNAGLADLGRQVREWLSGLP